jgi:methyl-accepting chemotaxis protein
MGKKRFFRKKKIVNPRYQYKFAFFVVGFLLIYSLILGTAIFLPLSMEMKATASVEDQARVAMVVLGLHEKLWPSLVGVLTLSFFGAILYSHRIVGPLVRLEKTVNESFLKGDFKERIRFRKKDELKEVEIIFNRLADYLERTKAEDSLFYGGLKQKIALICDQLDSADASAVHRVKDALNTLLGELDARPDVFSGHKA